MIKTISSPISWRGGKGKLAKLLVPLFPLHTSYIEPFCGGGVFCFRKLLLSVRY